MRAVQVVTLSLFPDAVCGSRTCALRVQQNGAYFYSARIGASVPSRACQAAPHGMQHDNARCAAAPQSAPASALMTAQQQCLELRSDAASDWITLSCKAQATQLRSCHPASRKERADVAVVYWLLRAGLHAVASNVLLAACPRCEGMSVQLFADRECTAMVHYDQLIGMSSRQTVVTACKRKCTCDAASRPASGATTL